MISTVRRGSLAAALGFLSCTALVQAADLPLKTMPPTFATPAIMNNWDGLYAGSTFGYGFTDYKTRQGGTRGVSASGATGGALVGYNFQSGHIVYGAEGSFDIGGGHKSDGGGGVIRPTRFEGLWDARLRGRLGYEFGWFMPFVAGGAVIDESYQSQVAPSNDFGQNKQSVGYTVGAGVDFRFNPSTLLPISNPTIKSFLGPMILRLEYIHDGLPTSTYAYNGQSYRTKSDSNIVRAAIISRFGETPPHPYVDATGTVNWAGPYGGVFGGGASTTSKTTSAAGTKTHLDASGALGGIYAGTNFMVYNRVMLGFEGSTAYSDINGHGAEPTGPASFRNYFQADLRGRAGYAFGSVLPFVAAGYEHGRSEQIDTKTGSQLGSLSNDAIEAGAGLDYRVSERVSLRGEYIHDFDLHKKLVNLNGCQCKQTTDGDVFRIGAAYHFE